MRALERTMLTIQCDRLIDLLPVPSAYFSSLEQANEWIAGILHNESTAVISPIAEAAFLKYGRMIG